MSQRKADIDPNGVGKSPTNLVSREGRPPPPTTSLVMVGGSGIWQGKIQHWHDTPWERGVWLNTIVAIYVAPGTDFNNSLESYVFSSLFVMLRVCF